MTRQLDKELAETFGTKDGIAFKFPKSILGLHGGYDNINSHETKKKMHLF